MAAQDNKKIRNLEDFAGIASDWFWETDAEHRFTYFSSRMQEITKFDPKQLIGRRRDTIPQGTTRNAHWRRHMDDLKAHRPFRNFEYTLIRPTDGSPLWVRVSGQPLFDADGTFVGYRGTGHNVTQEMEAMKRLKASNAALEDRNRELDEARRAIERTAYQDVLTDLPNRRSFEHDLNAMLARNKDKVALLHVDLDRFKWVNDTMGHPAGDAVLVEAAKRIQAIVGHHGQAYRVGGDEFLITLTGPDIDEQAMWIGDTVVEAMEEPVCFGKRRPKVGTSVGVAVADAQQIKPGRLIAYADVALYEAKHSGRNTVCRITPEMQSRMEEHRQLAAELPRAIAQRELVPFFQPQIDAETNTFIGAEALVRWQHPERGLLAPGTFLKAATEMGLIAQIDRMMLEAALAAVTRLADAGLQLSSVSVNVSEARLMDSELPEDVARLWVDRRCRLSIELLETIYFDEAKETGQWTENLRCLRDMGVAIETDDFGSGRASITGLLRIWPDRLKIDRSLVKEVIKDPTKRSVVAAIIEMTRALGIEGIAEGVETQEDIDAIRALGCRMFQGYAIARPLAEADLAAFLKDKALKPPAETQTAGRDGLPKIA